MTHDLLGYLLRSLDSAGEREVEEYLESSPEARREMRRLRKQLQPLETWEASELPEELFYKTLRTVASKRIERPAEQSASPARPKSKSEMLLQPWVASELAPQVGSWRRADVWVAFAMLVMVCLAIPPVLQFVRARSFQVECGDNMRQMYASLERYAEDHQGYFPAPESQGPFARAGIYAPTLWEEGLWPERLKMGCDPNMPTRPVALEEVRQHDPNDNRWWMRLGGSYGYHLGYVVREGDAIKLMAIRLGDGDAIPILADRPPRPGEAFDFYTGNSPNHGGRGQNVLHAGGHVGFQVSRCAWGGADQDIFLNQQKKPYAGNDKHDAVIAPSEARPLPPTIE